MNEQLREEIIQFFKNISPEAYHIDDAAYILHVKGADEIKEFMAIVQELVEEGELETKDGSYYRVPVANKTSPMEIEGIYKRYRNNFGFIVVEDGPDIFISDDNHKKAMNNDRVIGRITLPAKGNQKAEGHIVKIVERANSNIVGTFQREKHFGFVIPDDERIDEDIYVPLDASMDARSSAKVLVKVTKWPSDKNKQPEGVISEILGYEGTPGLDVSCIVAQHDLPFQFEPEVIKEAKAIDTRVLVDDKRLDLRNVQMITIDGEDAKDLDDAVSITLLDNGHYELGVHIADVSHYVQAHTALDKEAYKRGTSVYLVDRVIPMLPHELSNGICSLNANEDRYAMSCIMEIDDVGKVLKRTIRPSIIHIDRRCNYTEVYKALTEDIIPDDLMPFMDMLYKLYDVSKILLHMRRRRGALDFDFPEFKVIVDKEGRPLRIVKRVRTIAERIIEECMLIANETVACFLRDTGNPSVYRIHEVPSEEKLDNVKRILAYLGKEFTFEGAEIKPRDFQRFLREVAGTEAEMVAQYMVLRSMQQARYRVENKGHFGLASECYTHFTSPIRRYPDLMVHRLLKKALGWPEDFAKRDYMGEYLERAAEHSSQREQIAVETERDVDDLKKAQYMEQYVGQTFEGHINSITSFGMFVELENGVDGLVSVATMQDDYYFFDEEHFLMVGRHKGQTYHLGQPVTVTVLHVDSKKGQIDFLLGEVDLATFRQALYNKEMQGANRRSPFSGSQGKASRRCVGKYRGGSRKSDQKSFKGEKVESKYYKGVNAINDLYFEESSNKGKKTKKKSQKKDKRKKTRKKRRR